MLGFGSVGVQGWGGFRKDWRQWVSEWAQNGVLGFEIGGYSELGFGIVCREGFGILGLRMDREDWVESK